MDDRLKTIVDLKKYPIHDLRLSKIKKILKKYKSDLNQFICSTITNFIKLNSIGRIKKEEGISVRINKI
tara:strand:+ start:363 stop:569 length:207 start_codon:yes stop_codon:yes gene_type:complete